MTTDSGHISASQTHSVLPQCDGRPVILAKPSQQSGVYPEVVNLIFRLWGTPIVEMFTTVYNTHLPQFMSPVPVPRALGIDALSQDWQGRSMYMFQLFPLLYNSHSEAQDHSDMRGDSPLVAITTMDSTSTTSVCGPPMLISIPPRPAVTTGIYLERQVVPSACMEALMQHYHAAGFLREVSKLAAVHRRPSTNRMYDNRWLRFANWATGKGFDPLGPTAAQIAAFLYELFDTHGLSPQTIKV